MTTLETAQAAHHHEEEANRPAMNQLGLWLFFASETFLFAALATGRFYISGLDQPEHLNQLLGLGITSILLSSSILAYLAEAAIARGELTASMNCAPERLKLLSTRAASGTSTIRLRYASV